jgi:hypothetical protein
MQRYRDILTQRQGSVLPEPLQRALVRLGNSLRQNRVDGSEVTAILLGLSQLPAETYVKAGSEIVLKAELFWQPRQERSWANGILSPVGPARIDSDLLPSTPGLEYLYIFHSNGYLREAALAKIDGPVESPFFFSSIAYRLNDWVDPVRQAARACAARVFPQTAPAVIAEAAVVLLEHMRHWQRCEMDASILEEAFARPDVTQQLAELIMTATTGSPGRVLAQVLRGDRMDEYLLRLSREAVQPTVRALALRTLIQGHASWPQGFTNQWIDKSMGLSRRVVTYGERPLHRTVPIEALIAQGVADRSAMVRRIAADSLVQHRKSLSGLDDLVQTLVSDKSGSVRERALFILQEREREKL